MNPVANGPRLPRKNRLLHYDHQCDAHTGMEHVDQDIFTVDVVDIAIIRVSPIWRPRVHEHKRVASVNEASPTFHFDWTLHLERMASPKVCAESVIRNMAAFACWPGVTLLPLGRFLPTVIHLLSRLSLVSFLFLLVLFPRLAVFLPRRLHLILFRSLFTCLLASWLFLPRWFFFLLFFVLGV